MHKDKSLCDVNLRVRKMLEVGIQVLFEIIWGNADINPVWMWSILFFIWNLHSSDSIRFT